MQFPSLTTGAKVVGAVYSLRGLRVAQRLKAGALDFIEVRLDLLVSEIAQVERAVPKLQVPIILTARSPREGGANRLRVSQRIALLEKFLPHAAFVDLELASLPELAPVVELARARKVGVILSHHDFQKTVPLKELSRLATQAARAKADVFKVATQTTTAADVATLLTFLHARSALPLSVMGMGRFGKVSRLLCAQAGSVLNYGFLDQAAVPGQWPALLLKERLAELETTEG